MAKTQRYIFRNKKNYPVEVPTISGSGRTIQPGQILEGDYYLSLYSKVNFLEMLPPDTKYDPKLLVISAYRNEVATKLIDNIKAEYAETIETNRKVQEEVQEEVKSDEKLELSTSLEQTIKDAIKSTVKMYPTSEELSKMSTEELKVLANSIGVSYISPKTAFVKALKSKLANLNK